jgi:mRNA interferase MazF
VTRGDVYRIRLPQRRGHELHGARYAVLVQADELLGLSTALVAPTSLRAQAASFRPEVDIAGQRTRVMVEQLRALDVRWLDDFGHLSASEMRGVDEAVSLVFCPGLRAFLRRAAPGDCRFLVPYGSSNRQSAPG